MFGKNRKSQRRTTQKKNAAVQPNQQDNKQPGQPLWPPHTPKPRDTQSSNFYCGYQQENPKQYSEHYRQQSGHLPPMNFNQSHRHQQQANSNKFVNARRGETKINHTEKTFDHIYASDNRSTINSANRNASFVSSNQPNLIEQIHLRDKEIEQLKENERRHKQEIQEKNSQLQFYKQNSQYEQENRQKHDQRDHHEEEESNHKSSVNSRVKDFAQKFGFDKLTKFKVSFKSKNPLSRTSTSSLSNDDEQNVEHNTKDALSNHDLDDLSSTEDNYYSGANEIENAPSMHLLFDFENYETTALPTDDPEPSKPEYNILLLGESGAGKSTTINAFANYVKYASFQEASSVKKFVELIPSKFLLTNPKTGEEFWINSGSDDENECLDSVGGSRTQEPRAYKFLYQDKLIRIIDTPGMGDTRGLAVDKQNFNKILNYLKAYKKLHAICILIKAHEARKIASFRYCITELLTNLHRNACKNIVFCFTFSRNTFYAPGDGFVTLKQFLKEELAEVNIKLSANVNCFFVDNEAYRYLLAKRSNFPFAANQSKTYKESWDKSSANTNAMIKQILQLKPHNLAETFELNEIGKLIIKLAQPMIQIQLNIMEIINQIYQAKKQFNQSPDLNFALNVEIDNLKIVQFDRPVTVCTADCCTTIDWSKGHEKVHYDSHCHQDCTEIEIESDTVGQQLLKYCHAMGGLSKCQKCGCDWKMHMHQTVEYNLVRENLINPEEIFKQTDQRIQVQMLRSSLERNYTEFAIEINKIQELCGMFGYLLERHSNTSYVRFTEPYLDRLIDEENKKLKAILNYSDRKYQKLKNLKQTQVEMVQFARKELSSKNIQLDYVNHLCDKYLINLNYSGEKFRRIIETFRRNKQTNIGPNKDERIAIDLSGEL